MKYRLVRYKENIYTNYWVVPTVITLLAIVLAIFSRQIDDLIDHAFRFQHHWLFWIHPDSARLMLSIIASGVISITTVTFSITVLILSIASNQLGYRLLPNFMRQGRTQIVLGIFIGTFIYCLLILRTVDSGDQSSLPYLSILFGLALGIFSFFTLIFFIHYICHVLQVDNVLTYLSKDLKTTIDRQMTRRWQSLEKALRDQQVDEPSLKQQYRQLVTIPAKDSGYIQSINYQKCLMLAEKHNVFVEFNYRAGHYLFSGLPAIKISANEFEDSLIDDFQTLFVTGVRRATVQDIEYAFEQIAEIAIRMLSPSIASPYPAINCIDQIADGIVSLNNYQFHGRYLFVEDVPRVKMHLTTDEGIIDTALNRLRQQAVSDLTVCIYLLDTINKLLLVGMRLTIQEALVKHAELIYIGAKESVYNSVDRNALERRHETLQQLLAGSEGSRF